MHKPMTWVSSDPPNWIAPPRFPTMPQRKPPAHCVKRRSSAPATDADAEEVRSTLLEPPLMHSPHGHQSRGRRHSNSQQKRRSSGVGVGAGLGQKPVLRQIFGLKLDDMGETSNKARSVRTSREQFQHARPPLVARCCATLGTEFHRLDGTSDSESWLPSSRQERLSVPLNQRPTVSAFEQDCGVGAHRKLSSAHAVRPPALLSSSSPRACSAKVNAILADGLQLVKRKGSAITDVKRPASHVPASARPGRAAKSRLPAIHAPLSPRRTNLGRQPPLRSSLLGNESTEDVDLY